jgi:hypothetical protein
MSKILENTKNLTKFSGEFDRYDTDPTTHEVRVRLKNIRTLDGELVKESLLITQQDAVDGDLIGNLMIGQKVYFSSEYFNKIIITKY